MNDLVGGVWVEHERESWVWMRDRFIPYPLQNNIHLLPRNEFEKCVRGLIEATKRGAVPFLNFRDWIEPSFGAGLAESFLVPYNFKVWPRDPPTMSSHWAASRQPTPHLLLITPTALHT